MLYINTTRSQANIFCPKSNSMADQSHGSLTKAIRDDKNITLIDSDSSPKQCFLIVIDLQYFHV